MSQITVKFEKTLTNAYGLYDNYVMPYAAPVYLTITGEILKDDVVIGRLTMYELDGNIELQNMCLQIPGDIAVIADVVCDRNGKIKYDLDKFVILDQIYIEPEYRNQGYGSEIMRKLTVMLNDAYNHSIDAILLYASIFDVEEYFSAPIGKFEQDVERLVRFYERNGFENIENNVMIKMKG